MTNKDNNQSAPPPVDPLIDEVREIRKAIEDQTGGNVKALAEHIRRAGEDFRQRSKSPEAA